MAATRWQAPGRVNLIGEHTDYNDGFALPFAIGAACVAEVSPGRDGVFRARSVQQGSAYDVGTRDLADLPRGGVPQWVRYVLGPAWVLTQRQVEVPPLEVVVDSAVPMGAGLASSAAVVCAVTAALDDLLGTALARESQVSVARAVENDVVGAPTGGMDQLASVLCRADHALLCDMRTLRTEHVPMPLAAADLTVLVVDTGESHSHASGEYAERRLACAEAARLLGVPALRDVPLARLDESLMTLDSEVLRRCTRHVVTENDRVQRVAALLRDGRLEETGPALSASHASLRDDYRVSTARADLAVETLLEADALGARLTGGGFGGCVIALVPRERVSNAVAAVRKAYRELGHPDPTTFTVSPSAGARRI